MRAGPERVAGHDPYGDEIERDQRQQAGDDQPLVERRHHVPHARAGLDEAAADDRCKDRHAAERERIDHRGHRRRGDHQRAERHRRDQRHGIGLEQVGGHAGAVADVVTDVVGDHRRIARIVFGNAGLDLADEVGADVGTLREDASAQTREDRDQRCTEREPEQRLQQVGQVGGGRELAEPGDEPEEDADAEQAEPDHQHAGDRTAFERDGERRRDALRGGLRSTHVGSHRDVHADEAACPRQHRAEHEADRCLGAQEHADEDREHHADDGDRLVLPCEVGGGPLLHGAGDFLHARVPGRLGENPAALHETINDRSQAAGEREVKRHRRGHQGVPSSFGAVSLE